MFHLLLSILMATTCIELIHCSDVTESTAYEEMQTSIQVLDNATVDHIHTETCSDPMQEYVSPVHGDPKCCRKCDKGFGMLRLCTDSEETHCIGCESGLEFSPYQSATMKCQQCQRCQDIHSFAVTRTKCTPMTDTECGCLRGYYMSLEKQVCERCSVCGTHEGVVKPCQWNADTQCEACPKGFWAARIRNTVKCLPCSSCSDDQILASECQPNADSLCCPKSNVNCTANPHPHGIRSPFALPNSATTNSVIQQSQMIPIYCSIMGLIIVFLTIYVIYKLWRQHEAMKNTKLSDVESIMSTVNGTNKSSDQSCGRRWPSNRIDQSKHSSPSNTIGQYSPLPVDRRVGQETVPLLDANCGAMKREPVTREHLLKDCPMDVLGVQCCQCSRVDFEKLSKTFDVDPKRIMDSEWTTLHDSLLQAALQFKDLYCLPIAANSTIGVEQLQKFVRIIIYLCAQSSKQPTYGFFSDTLRSVLDNQTSSNGNPIIKDQFTTNNV